MALLAALKLPEPKSWAGRKTLPGRGETSEAEVEKPADVARADRLKSELDDSMSRRGPGRRRCRSGARSLRRWPAARLRPGRGAGVRRLARCPARNLCATLARDRRAPLRRARRVRRSARRPARSAPPDRRRQPPGSALSSLRTILRRGRGPGLHGARDGRLCRQRAGSQGAAERRRDGARRPTVQRKQSRRHAAGAGHGIERSVTFTILGDSLHGSSTYIIEVDGDGDAAGPYSVSATTP